MTESIIRRDLGVTHVCTGNRNHARRRKLMKYLDVMSEERLSKSIWYAARRRPYERWIDAETLLHHTLGVGKKKKKK
jgi:hypothetical protein